MGELKPCPAGLRRAERGNMKTYVMTEQESAAIRQALTFAYRNAPGNTLTDAQIASQVFCDIKEIIKHRKRKQAQQQYNRIANAINALIADLPEQATCEAWVLDDETGAHFELGITLPNVRIR